MYTMICKRCDVEITSDKKLPKRGYCHQCKLALGFRGRRGGSAEHRPWYECHHCHAKIYATPKGTTPLRSCPTCQARIKLKCAMHTRARYYTDPAYRAQLRANTARWNQTHQHAIRTRGRSNYRRLRARCAVDPVFHAAYLARQRIAARWHYYTHHPRAS